MKKFMLFCSAVMSLSCSHAQYQTANWPLTSFGWILKIMPGTFEVDTPLGGASGFIANSSVSDAQGNLLFYSFGDAVHNRDGYDMENGSLWLRDFGECGQNLNPHMQGAIILPKPGSNTQFYLVLKDKPVTNKCQPTRVTLTTIDLSYNNGLGKVIERSKPILNDTLSDSRMTACKHANGRDWWLVNHEYNTNRIYTNLITPDSVYGPFSQYIGALGLEADNAGWSLFTQDGSLFTTTTLGMKKITLLDFDRCSGTFSNNVFIRVNSTNPLDMLAFSPNGRFLYGSNFSYLYQYDLHSSNIDSSIVLVKHDTINQPGMGMMVLMPGNKIYQAGWTCCGDCMSVIDSPDLKAPDCSFQFQTVCIPDVSQIRNTPNFPNYNLGPLVGSGCDTITTTSSPQTPEGGLKDKIQVYPNPTSDFVVIDYRLTDWSKGDVTLEIINSIGQVVYQSMLPRYSGFHQVDVRDYARGIYAVVVKRNGLETVAVARFTKQ